MRFFFRSKKFKVLISVILCLAIVSVGCIIVGGRISPQSDFFGTVLAPFKTAGTKIANGVEDFFAAYTEGDKALVENSELEAELAELRDQLADYEKTQKENEFYKNYLDIKDKNPDFKFTPATLISRDKKDPFGGFTINAGSVDGLSEHDPVITDAGLVGYVTDVGLTTAKVVTILSPDLTLGALDNRTSDSGILYGSLSTAEKGYTGLYNLSRSCNVAVGDYIVSSGEGIFPEGLLIGTVQSIGSEKYNTSIYAQVKPFVEIDEIRDVMVITSFKGQGGLDPDKK